jgi:hypothetical protein
MRCLLAVRGKIGIWEHGGAFGVEHGQFVDIEDSEHMPLGAVVVRRA